MGAYESDEHLMGGVGHLDDQPKVVAADVEYGPRSNPGRVREVAPDVDEVPPLRLRSHLEPRPERHLGLRMPNPELLESSPRNDPHDYVRILRTPGASRPVASAGPSGRRRVSSRFASRWMADVRAAHSLLDRPRRDARDELPLRQEERHDHRDDRDHDRRH